MLLKVAKELFAKLYDKRLLVRLVGIRFTQLIPGNYQIRLYEDTQENINLFKAIDSVKKQFGEDKLIRAGAIHRMG